MLHFNSSSETKKEVINCTALSNNQLRISGAKYYAQLGLFYNKKCHKHVTNAPKGIGLAQDTFEER